MKVLFTICARAGSKGVKGKNVSMFCGKPLVYYTWKAYCLFKEQYGKKYADIDLAVNTDSEELVRQLDELGAEYIYIKREENLAGDVVSKMDVIKDTLKKTEEKNGKVYDTVMDLDLTSPFRTVKDVEGVLNALLESADADISFSVTDSRRSPYFNMVCKKEDGFYHVVTPSGFVSRQQVPVCYDMNASIYAYRREYLLNGTARDRKSAVWIMRDTAVLDIDSESDKELMEYLAPYFFKKYSDYVQ